MNPLQKGSLGVSEEVIHAEQQSELLSKDWFSSEAEGFLLLVIQILLLPLSLSCPSLWLPPVLPMLAAAALEDAPVS